MSSLLAVAPAVAWPSGMRRPCLAMNNVALSSTCESGQQRTTRLAFTMEEVRAREPHYRDTVVALVSKCTGHLFGSALDIHMMDVRYV